MIDTVKSLAARGADKGDISFAEEPVKNQRVRNEPSPIHTPCEWGSV